MKLHTTLLASASLFIAASANNDERDLQQGGPIKCTVIETHGMPEENGVEVDEILQCEVDPDFNHGVFGELLTIEGLDDDQKGQINSGKTILTASNAVRNPRSPRGPIVTVDPLDVNLEGTDDGGDLLSPVVEEPMVVDKPMLILYTVGLDVTNDQRSSVQMAQEVFGLWDVDPYSLKDAIDEMSKGQTNYFPGCSRSSDACFGDTNIVNGVIECVINQNIIGINWSTVGNWNANYANTILSVHGLSVNDFQIFHVISRRADFQGAAAWGQKPGKVSWYRDDYSYRVGVQVHEIGHNLDHSHSGHGSASYSDHHCSMGNPSYGDDSPKVAFNGQKAWHSGWYNSDNVQVAAASGANFDGTLVGIADYVQDRYTSGQHKVVVQIPEPSRGSAFAYYMLFNRKEGVNGGVNFNPDTVILVEGSSPRSQSWTVAVLSMSGTTIWRTTNFNGSGRTLTVELCSINLQDNSAGPDEARVLVYLDNNVLSCTVAEAPSQSPTFKAPSSAPSNSPIGQPSKGPTNSPTISPSKGPTNSPTISHAPTKSPTQKPVKTRPTKPPKGDGGGGGEKPTKPPKGDGGGGGGGGGKGKMNVDCLQNLLRGFLGNGR